MSGYPRLSGKTAIVTESTSGIGRATAERFVAEGARVTVVGRGALAGGDVERQLRERGGDALFVQADVSNAEDVERVVQATAERWGGIDVLVNNAATMTFDPIAQLSERIGTGC